MLVSMYILCFNHQDFVAEAIRGALAQTYNPLEIIISDDASEDRTWEIIQETVADYKGPHQVIVRRNDHNLGISEHINECWKQCSGKWIVASAGDDVSLPERVQMTVNTAKRYPSIKLIQALLNEVDEDGSFISTNMLGIDSYGALYDVYLPNRFQEQPFNQHGAAMSYHRDVIDLFGPLPNDVIFEDNIVNIRAELIGGCGVLKVPLVQHRNHSGQITKDSIDIPHATVAIRAKRRLYSDVVSSSQNVVDFQKIYSGTNCPANVGNYANILLLRRKFFLLRYYAATKRWPLRLFYFARLIIYRHWACRITRREILNMIMPDFAWRIHKALALR